MFFKILTFNIWFDTVKFARRNRQIKEIIDTHEPDIVCMQEVLPNSLNYFKSNLDDYYFSIAELDKRYGEVILSRSELFDIQRIKFESIMGRELHCATTKLGKKDVRVATFHLESIFHDASLKLQQFKNSIHYLQEYDDVFLMGDTNITDNDEKYFNLVDIAPAWHDVWIELDRPENSEFTYDSINNTYADDPFRNRLDRIYYKSNEYYPIAIKLVGTQPTDNVYASDHFGVLSIFDY